MQLSMNINKYPIYGHQSHPEKIQFIDYEPLDIPKSENAIESAKYLAKFFVDECKLNANEFESLEKLEDLLLKNYTLLHIDENVQDIYVFNE